MISTMYDADMLQTASERGYDHAAHLAALESENEDQIGLTHPSNWLTEFEVEVCATLDLLLSDGLVERVSECE